MKKSKFITFALSTVALSMSLVGCTDYDMGATDAKTEFAKNFVETFGNVDPNATWNATRSGSVQVTVDDLAQVMVYAKGLGTNLQLRCTVLEAGETRTINFDAPMGVNDIYVVATNKKDFWQSRTVSINGAKVAFSKGTRAAVDESLPAEYNYGKANLIDFVNNSYTFTVDGDLTSANGAFIPDLVNQYSGSNRFAIANPNGYKVFPICPIDTWGALYTAYPWPYTSAATEPVTKRFESIGETDAIEVPHNHVTLSEEFRAALNNVVTTADNRKEILEPFTEDLEFMTTVEPGQVELTYAYSQTNSKNAIGYYYTEGPQTTESLKAVKKFILIPNMKEAEIGDKFKLVYFGKNYDEEGTYNFPKDVQIHFFLAREPANTRFAHIEKRDVATSYHLDGSDAVLDYTLFEDVYCAWLDYFYFSDSELNDVVKNLNFSAFDFPATAAFSAMGQNCISFEDWPEAGSIDWNDVIFTIDAPFGDFKSFDETQSFFIAMEDLGDTEDFDFNDVVMRLSQTKTTIKRDNGTTVVVTTPAKATLMAAGGTMPVKVGYDKNDNGVIDADEVIFNEVHEAFGVSVLTMVNTGRVSKTPVSTDLDGILGDEEILISKDAPKILFLVENNKEDERAGTYTTINVPKSTGAIPQAFIIPDATTYSSWQWPSERQLISDKYPEFNTWVTNNSAAGATFWYNYQWGKTYSSGGGSVDPNPEGPSEEPSVDPQEPANTDVIDLMQYVSGGSIPSTVFDGKSTATVTISIKDDGWNVGFYGYYGNYSPAPGSVSIIKGETETFTLDAATILAIKAEGEWKFTFNGGESCVSAFTIQ